MLWWSGTALVEVELLTFELHLRDIEDRLTVAELDADLEALRAKHCELADDGLADDAGLVTAARPGPWVSQTVASGRLSQASRASLSGSFRSLSDNNRSLSNATPGATARAFAPWPLVRAGPRVPGCARRAELAGPRPSCRARRAARADPRALGYARRAALTWLRPSGLPMPGRTRWAKRVGLRARARPRRAPQRRAARRAPWPGPTRGAYIIQRGR
jgi:hypothetical protein